ncbi:uncharacterized protein LOC125900325 [Epinephelus fuscoguttatus]|uniref:uncharacterized protein LOC125900325 n=1 Tax=Epinephelus fuscoguttatus TaxID=293821 RepID=UPI0020D093D4|nr:uncharacterized protein LOC125900325 [Epinephelus fuscoguttatus]
MQLLRDPTTFHPCLKQVSPPLHSITQIPWTTMSSSLQLPGQCTTSTYKSSPPTQPHHRPPPIQSSPPTQPQHRPVTAWPLYQLLVTQSLPQTHPYYQHPPIQPLHTNAHKNPAVLGDQSQASMSELKNSSSSSGTPEHENSSSSTADTIITEHDPIPDYGEPILRPPESAEDRSWKPCGACKAEVAKVMEEKDKLQDVLCGISGDHIKALKSFLDKVEQIQPQTGVWAPKNRCGKQELYPESGLFLTSTRLLFDEFFNAEECQNAVAFGKHGKVPDGKTVLDKSKVVGNEF